MTTTPMTSLQRVLTTLQHREPDRVPLFLLVSLHGARELGVSIQEYFTRAEHIVEAQIRMRAAYRNDCLYAFFYAAIDVEAWGGEVIFSDDGPPNAGEPFIYRPDQIRSLQAPRVQDAACLHTVLEAIQQLHIRSQGEVPIIGVVVAPFSLPVMQMGFEAYLNLMFEQPDLFDLLMRINEDFCVEWANAQLAAGATAICYFDPVASSTIISRDHYLRSAFLINQRTLARINGPTATHFASGRCLPIVADVACTGTAAIGVSALDDLAALKRIVNGKVSLLGSLNGVEMRRWTPAETDAAVSSAIAAAGQGGGFILADNHGEIPFQVPETTLQAIADAVDRWGTYPLKQASHEG